MSALHRLKAYFGMVPGEDFDDDDPGYRSGYDPTYFHPGYDLPAANPSRERGYAVDPSLAHRARRADFDSYADGFATTAPTRSGPTHPAPTHAAETQSGPAHPAGPRVRTTQPPAWAPAAPVHGSLAVDTAQPVRHPAMPTPRTSPFTDDEAHPLARIVTLHPHNYNEARPIGERYRAGNPVIMNLTEMDDRDAKRLVDFAAGLAFALRGSIDKVTNKVFLLSPPDVDVSAEDRRRIAEGNFFN
ncbi:MAG TPA: cell division protein SepF [Pseudonocardiaceae bacterium]